MSDREGVARPTMAADERRFVLIKPGDVLLIGGADVGPDNFDMVRTFFAEGLGVRVAFFAADIDVSKLSAADVERLGP